MIKHIRIATRKSPLALVQSHYVAQMLQARFPALTIEFISQLTAGDRNTEVALNTLGGKNLFVKELQALLLDNHADIAVHSVKDLSCTAHAELCLAAICEREDPRDVLITHQADSLAALAPGSVIGTSSPRRECQLRHLRPDLVCRLLRGNVETRLNKLQQGEYDAIVLAAAGLKRLDKLAQVTAYFSVEELLPAIGQGAIGVECRRDHAELRELLDTLNHAPSAVCVHAERAVNAQLGGDCFTPLAAHATLSADTLHLQAMVGSLTDARMITANAQGPASQPEQLGTEIAEQLLRAGAGALLNQS